MAQRGRTYVWQFTIGLGFLSGLWTAIGIDPEQVLLNLIGTVSSEISANAWIREAFIVLPTLLLIFSVWGAYRKGKALGLASVLIAYIAGLSILVSLWSALVLLLAAIAIGYLAPRKRR